MYWFCLMLLCGLLGIVLFNLGLWKERRYTKNKDQEPTTIIIGTILVVLAVMFLILGSIASLNASGENYNLIEEVRASNAKISILEEKAQKYTKEFSVLLAEAYPKHEKAIFGNLTQAQLLVYAVKYPSLKSMEGFKLLVKQIADTNDDLYDERLTRENVIAKIRSNKVSPWFISVIIPGLPDDVK